MRHTVPRLYSKKIMDRLLRLTIVLLVLSAVLLCAGCLALYNARLFLQGASVLTSAGALVCAIKLNRQND